MSDQLYVRTHHVVVSSTGKAASAHLFKRNGRQLFGLLYLRPVMQHAQRLWRSQAVHTLYMLSLGSVHGML